MMVINPLTGQKAKAQTKKTIIESYKDNNINRNKANILGLDINDRLKNNSILRFY